MFLLVLKHTGVNVLALLQLRADGGFFVCFNVLVFFWFVCFLKFVIEIIFRSKQ